MHMKKKRQKIKFANLKKNALNKEIIYVCLKFKIIQENSSLIHKWIEVN